MSWPNNCLASVRMQVITSPHALRWPTSRLAFFPKFEIGHEGDADHDRTNHSASLGALNAEEFAEAYCHGYPITLRFLRSRGASTDLAEEVTQAAWAKGWERLGQLRQPRMISAWVNSIAKNMLINGMRHEQKRQPLTDSQCAWPSLAALDIKRILAGCTNTDRSILYGSYVEGHTTLELADQLGLNPINIRVRLCRLRRSLRSQVERGT